MPYSVTIIGGTGSLGEHITNAFLTDFRSSFSHVRVLTRDPASAKAQALQAKGAELRKLADDELDVGLAGADVIVNALPSGAPMDTKRAIVQAVAKSSAKVYFLSEFGTDHRDNDFPGYEHDEWALKKKFATETRAAAKDKKIIALYTSGFLEYMFAFPALGFDLPNNVYACYGPASQRVTMTSQGDIGRSVARLAILALDPASAAQVPDEVRIAGSTVSYEDVRDLVARIKGVGRGEIRTSDLAKRKEALRETHEENFLEYLRVIMGEGKMDYSTTNENELINPGETVWKWKTAEEQIRGL